MLKFVYYVILCKEILLYEITLVKGFSMNIDHLEAWEQLQKQLTWKQLGEFEGKKILEFGCGNGVMGAYYAGRNNVIAIDPDEKTLSDNVHSDVTQICGDIK